MPSQFTYKNASFLSQNWPKITLVFQSDSSGKEKDSETGYYYFGARYYNPDLSLWLSVDPMADKYPSLSPYNYCAWNPMKLVDPDGRKIFAANAETQKYIAQYITDFFGASSMFRFRKNGEMKINRSEYKSFLKSATADQRTLLSGLKKAIKTQEKATITIQKNNNKFEWHGQTDLEVCDPSMTIKKGSGATSKDSYPIFGHVIGINDRGTNNDFFSAGIDENGNRNYVQPPASTTFIHEVLDEFLNFYTNSTTTESSPNIDKVQYQNTALRILGMTERDGTDHNY